MKKFEGYEAKRSGNARETLPAGGYVCKIFKAEEETYSWGSVLVLSIDVTEGEYAGIWTRDYKNNTNEDKKWRGTMRLTVPKDDGSEKDAWTKNSFNNAMWAIEASNPGYVWNWDERSLKDKLVGVIYRDREWEMNGNTGWTTEAGGLTSVDDIRNNTFKALKPKPIKNKPAAAAPAFTDLASDDDGELPF
jgi:hypothetical protein